MNTTENNVAKENNATSTTENAAPVAVKLTKEQKEAAKAEKAAAAAQLKADKAAAKEAAKPKVIMPEDNAAQYATSEELKTILTGGKALTSKIQKVKQTSASKLGEGFPSFLHLLPINATRSLAFVWDTREIQSVVDTSTLTEEDYVNRVKDSGLPLRVSADNAEILALLK